MKLFNTIFATLETLENRTILEVATDTVLWGFEKMRVFSQETIPTTIAATRKAASSAKTAMRQAISDGLSNLIYKMVSLRDWVDPIIDTSVQSIRELPGITESVSMADVSGSGLMGLEEEYLEDQAYLRGEMEVLPVDTDTPDQTPETDTDMTDKTIETDSPADSDCQGGSTEVSTLEWQKIDSGAYEGRCQGKTFYTVQKSGSSKWELITSDGVIQEFSRPRPYTRAIEAAEFLFSRMEGESPVF